MEQRNNAEVAISQNTYLLWFTQAIQPLYLDYWCRNQFFKVHVKVACCLNTSVAIWVGFASVNCSYTSRSDWPRPISRLVGLSLPSPILPTITAAMH